MQEAILFGIAGAWIGFTIGMTWGHANYFGFTVRERREVAGRLQDLERKCR